MKEKKAKIKPDGKAEAKTPLKFKVNKNENWQPPRKPEIRIKVNLKDLPSSA